MNKTATVGVAEIIKDAQALLDAKCRRSRFRLRIPKRGYAVDDDWVTLIVNPDKPGMRAYDYVEILIAVEKELRARGHEHVLLVPAMSD